jgi:hypothetical protein
MTKMTMLLKCGKTKDDLPMGPCEWWYDEVDLTYGTSCNRSFDELTEYCPNCQGKVELWEDE